MKVQQPERLVELLESERHRMARDLHDGPAQHMTNTTMRLEVVKKLIENDRIHEAVQELDKLQSMMRSAMNDIRRMIFDLRPVFLAQGISETAERYIERFSELSGVAVALEGSFEEGRLTTPQQMTLFRVLQEALQNVHKHAKAAQVVLRVETTGERCRMTVRDDGKGFDLSKSATNSFGLQGMRERVELVDGQLSISSKLGEGTTVVCEIVLTDE